MVVVRLDPHHTRLLRRPESDREHRPERHRHLPENVPRAAVADNALEPIDELDRLDPTLENSEERALVALMHGVLARHQTDVRCYAGETVAVHRVEGREDRDPTDLVRRHHGSRSLSPSTQTTVLRRLLPRTSTGLRRLRD